MKPEEYPSQEPFSELAKAYHDEVMRRGASISGQDYSYGADAYQGLTVFPAARPGGDVLIFVHGGGWTNGYKEWMAFMAPALTEHGVTFISVGYRLAPAHIFPTGVEDCMDGLAWVFRNISEHGGDPARLFVGGHSAGGHYTSLMAVRRDWQAGRELPREVVRGCLPISGVYEFGETSDLSGRPRFLGPVGNERAASPIQNLQGTPPPFLMAHGERDFPHLAKQAVEMERTLKAVGGDVTRLELKDCDHLAASYVSGDPKGLWVSRATAWMRAH